MSTQSSVCPVCHQQFVSPAQALAAISQFAASQGIDADRFRQTMRGFGVDAKVRQALETSRRVGLDGVPALVANGRFLTSPTLAGNRERTLAVLDYLVAKT